MAVVIEKGICSKNVVPPIGDDLILIEPERLSICDRTMSSPTPRPEISLTLEAVENPGWNSRSSNCRSLYAFRIEAGIVPNSKARWRIHSGSMPPPSSALITSTQPYPPSRCAREVSLTPIFVSKTPSFPAFYFTCDGKKLIVAKSTNFNNSGVFIYDCTSTNSNDIFENEVVVDFLCNDYNIYPIINDPNMILFWKVVGCDIKYSILNIEKKNCSTDGFMFRFVVNNYKKRLDKRKPN